MSYEPRVYLRAPAHGDEHEFTSLMRESRAFHRPWATAPTDSERFLAYLTDSQRPDFEAMLVCRYGDDAILGFFNLSQIARGSMQSAYLGYAIGRRYAGQGYMREGIELVLRRAFVDLRLHRIEANIQPDNTASTALRTRRRLPTRGILSQVPQDQRPLARPRTVGAARRGLARRGVKRPALYDGIR